MYFVIRYTEIRIRLLRSLESASPDGNVVRRFSFVCSENSIQRRSIMAKGKKGFMVKGVSEHKGKKHKGKKGMKKSSKKK